MNTCNFCGAQGLEWQENLRLLVNPITGEKHGKQHCEPQKISRYYIENGVRYDRKDGTIALKITEAAIALGIKDPTKARIKEQGDYLIVSKR